MSGTNEGAVTRGCYERSKLQTIRFDSSRGHKDGELSIEIKTTLNTRGGFVVPTSLKKLLQSRVN